MAKRRNTKRRKRGKGPKSKLRQEARRVRDASEINEPALRQAIQRMLAADGTPAEVFKLVAQNVTKIAQEQLKNRPPAVVAAASKDVQDKLLSIASEELLAAGHSKEAIKADIEKIRKLEGTGWPEAHVNEQITDFVRTQLLKGIDAEGIKKQVDERWGAIADSPDWRQTTDMVMREIIESASGEDVQAILEGARAQGPEALKHVQEIVADRVADESGLGHIKGIEGFTPAIPDRHQSRERMTPQEQTIDAYMEATAQAYQLTRTRPQTPERQREANFLWRCFRDARVFHFDPDTYVALHQEIDRYTTEELAGHTYRPPGSFRPADRVPQEESDDLRATILRECKHVPYPDKFPFPCVFLGYGSGVQLPKHQVMRSAPTQLRERLEVAAIFGHLLTDDGSVYAVVKGSLRTDTGRTGVLWFDPLCMNRGWVRCEFNLEPWILPSLIKIINDHRTFIIENTMSRGLRKDYKRNRKGMGIKPNKRAYAPPPYYTLRMKSKLIRDKVRKHLPKPAPPKTYKTDVRAHERCRVSRGLLPLDPETGAKLRKRGYKIFTTNSLDLDTYRRLHERGQPYKKADEWLALLVTWVEEHMTSNDPQLPYVPAVRVPGEVRLKPRQPTGGWADDPRS